MNAVLDFIRGAAPWAIIGALEVIFIVKSVAKEQESKKLDERHSTGGKQA